MAAFEYRQAEELWRHPGVDSCNAPEQALGPGWRCGSCGYPMDGLPDRAANTQCPECGKEGNPAGATAGPPRWAWALAGIVSALFGAAAVALLDLAYAVSHADTSDEERRVGGLIGLGVCLLAAYVTVVVWPAAAGRWTFARWIGAVALLALFGATVLGVVVNSRWQGFDMVRIALSGLGILVLLQWDIARWLGLRYASAPR